MDSEAFLEGARQTYDHYVVRDADGKPLAFYHEAIHGSKLIPRLVHVEGATIRDFPTVRWELIPNPDRTIPEHAERISEEEWRAYMDGVTG